MGRWLGVGIVLLGLAGCQMNWFDRGAKSSPPGLARVMKTSPRGQSAATYLAHAQKEPDSPDWLLLATGTLLQEDSYDRAEQCLASLSQMDLSDLQWQEFHLYYAELAFSRGKYQAANKMLIQLDPAQLHNQHWQQRYYQLTAKIAQQQKQYWAEAKALAQLKTHKQQLWQALRQLSPEQLKTALEETEQPLLRGYLRLALITQMPEGLTTASMQALKTWHNQFPKHPGHSLLPHKLEDIDLQPNPEHIALLLPLSGPLADAGNSVKDGFLSAYYQAKNPSKIKFYDTHQQDINKIYQQAVSEGAEFILGPLDRSRVKQLRPRGPRVPTITLNYNPSRKKMHPDIFQFGLSPLDEARQVAERAYRDTHRRALIIAPNNNRSQSITEAFKAHWSGEIAGEIRYGEHKKIPELLAQGLEVDKSQLRIRELKRRLSNSKLKAPPRRRQDIDMIFLLANNQRARQIMPQLKFLYAGHIPVYATSNIYSGQVNKHRDSDLNHIQFPEIPWILKPNKSTNIGQHNNTQRLYALGLDAYHLSQHWNQLRYFSQISLQGQTGELILNPGHKIARKLDWATFKDGLVCHV